MTLSNKYDEWPETAKIAYRNLKTTCNRVRNYVDITDETMLKINTMVQHAETVDTGNGEAFKKAERIIKDKVLTQTY